MKKASVPSLPTNRSTSSPDSRPVRGVVARGILAHAGVHGWRDPLALDEHRRDAALNRSSGGIPLGMRCTATERRARAVGEHAVERARPTRASNRSAACARRPRSSTPCRPPCRTRRSTGRRESADRRRAPLRSTSAAQRRPVRRESCARPTSTSPIASPAGSGRRSRRRRSRRPPCCSPSRAARAARASSAAQRTSAHTSSASTGTATPRGMTRAMPAASLYTARASASTRNAPRNSGGGASRPSLGHRLGHLSRLSSSISRELPVSGAANRATADPAARCERSAREILPVGVAHVRAQHPRAARQPRRARCATRICSAASPTRSRTSRRCPRPRRPCCWTSCRVLRRPRGRRGASRRALADLAGDAAHVRLARHARPRVRRSTASLPERHARPRAPLGAAR